MGFPQSPRSRSWCVMDDAVRCGCASCALLCPALCSVLCASLLAGVAPSPTAPCTLGLPWEPGRSPGPAAALQWPKASLYSTTLCNQGSAAIFFRRLPVAAAVHVGRDEWNTGTRQPQPTRARRPSSGPLTIPCPSPVAGPSGWGASWALPWLQKPHELCFAGCFYQRQWRAACSDSATKTPDWLHSRLLLHSELPACDAVKVASFSFAWPRCATQFAPYPRILARTLCLLWSARFRWHRLRRGTGCR